MPRVQSVLWSRTQLETSFLSERMKSPGPRVPSVVRKLINRKCVSVSGWLYVFVGGSNTLANQCLQVQFYSLKFHPVNTFYTQRKDVSNPPTQTRDIDDIDERASNGPPVYGLYVMRIRTTIYLLT